MRRTTHSTASERTSATFSPASYEAPSAYPWQARFNFYSDEHRRFLRSALRTARSPFLEVGCGLGELSCYLGHRGFNVSGFDLSPEAVRAGRRMVDQARLGSRVTLAATNTQHLEYADETFASAVGHGVLHHIAKYPGTAEELHRVMKPGSRAVFLENLGNGPWRLMRRWTMLSTENEQFGDINLTTRFLKDWASPFRAVRIRGFDLALMSKRLAFVRDERPDGTVGKRCRFNGAA